MIQQSERNSWTIRVWRESHSWAKRVERFISRLTETSKSFGKTFWSNRWGCAPRSIFFSFRKQTSDQQWDTVVIVWWSEVHLQLQKPFSVFDSMSVWTLQLQHQQVRVCLLQWKNFSWWTETQILIRCNQES